MPYLTTLLPLLFAAALAWLLQHFLGSLAWAGLLAVITWPLHARLLRKGWSRAGGASALIGILLVTFNAPAIFLFNALSS